jgi:glycine/sarcosine N-methyltransferase
MYDDLAALYDLFVDWPKRLNAELPHLKRLGVGLEGQSVLDVACGTGRHAMAWAGQGCKVVACDPGAEMIAVAKEGDAASAVDWHVRGMLDLPEDVSADALVCIGTSLPHVASKSDYQTALGGFRDSMTDGGRIVIHSRNLRRVMDSNDRYMPPLPRDTPEGTVLFWRFYDMIPPDHIDFNMAIFRERDNSWSHDVLTSRLCVVSADELLEMAATAGLKDASCYGHLDGRPYIADESPDMVLVADR